MYRNIALLSSFIAAASAQQAGTQQEETHPAMSWQDCSSGECTDVEGQVVIDSNWRWVHTIEGYTNCYTGNAWNETICPDNASCAESCAVDGADYEATYGITADGTSLTLSFVKENDSGKNVGSRLYMMEDEETYQIFKLLNREFTFDVDVSKLDCGLNGALYFVSMAADGGIGTGSNQAGAKYGTGYCDAQCPRDLKFINGEANVEGWTPSDTDENAGVGGHGACCAEMDVWESNSISTAVTPHSCDTTTLTVCDGEECGGTYSETRYAGTCDPDGCDFNAYRMGDDSFFGPGKTVDSSQVVTVVTQFITADGTDTGALSEIRRFYVQGGKTIANAESKVEGVSGNSITSDFCVAQKEAFGDENTYAEHGGWESMGQAMADGMVLVMSLWDDHYAHMLWLDGSYPTESNATTPGVARGSCAADSGDPADIESSLADASVTFSNIKFGALNSTFTAA